MTALSYIYSSQIAILEQQGKKKPTRSAYVYMQDLLFQVDWNLLFFTTDLATYERESKWKFTW